VSSAVRLALTEHSTRATRELGFVVQTLIIAGWTGRDAKVVQAHIRELEALGISAPPRTPMFYRVAAHNLTSAASIEVCGRASSGEAEVVLLAGESELWVGLGSDHTDRELEKRSITLSKQICAKPIAATVWPHADVSTHWDRLELRSYVRNGGEQPVLYQQGSVATLRDPLELARAYGSAQLGAGSALYCGTLPVRGAIRFSDHMTLELHDPVLGRSIRHEYSIVALPAEY
jgi:Protein of unknown function (DUF2848)